MCLDKFFRIGILFKVSRNEFSKKIGWESALLYFCLGESLRWRGKDHIMLDISPYFDLIHACLLLVDGAVSKS